jgi:hypothetical protein
MSAPSFGTVVVYTCDRHCWIGRDAGDVVVEVTVAQQDPDDTALAALLSSSQLLE